jgi:hypothetical protein
MDLYHSRAGWIGVEASGLDSRIDLAPLPDPVLADSFGSIDPAAFHAIGPIDLGVQGAENGLNVSAVKDVIYVYEQITVCHRQPLYWLSISRLLKAEAAPKRDHPQIDPTGNHAS